MSDHTGVCFSERTARFIRLCSPFRLLLGMPFWVDCRILMARCSRHPSTVNVLGASRIVFGKTAPVQSLTNGTFQESDASARAARRASLKFLHTI